LAYCFFLFFFGFSKQRSRLCDGHASATGGLDLFFGAAGEELGLDDERLCEALALAEDLEVACGDAVNDGDGASCAALALTVLLGDQRWQCVHVDDRAETVGGARSLVEVTHTDFPEVTRVIFVEVDAVMVLATGVTAATVVLAVLADTAVAVGHVAPQFAALLLGLDHLEGVK